MEEGEGSAPECDRTLPTGACVFTDTTGKTKTVTTLEEEEYPHYYHKTVAEGDEESGREAVQEPVKAPASPKAPLQEKHVTFQENQKGVSYDSLLGPYLEGSGKITVTDPYIRLFYQVRNFMEFLETIVKIKAREDEVEVHLVTVEDEYKADSQKENFVKIQESAAALGVTFTWEFDGSGTLHARHIVTDHGWKVSLDRGLDIFQHYEMNDSFAFTNRLQQFRSCKAFEATFIKTGESRNEN